MRLSLLLALALLATVSLSACTQTDTGTQPVVTEADEAPAVRYAYFGESIDQEGLALRTDDLLAEPNTHDGQMVRVEGEIVEVCQQAGCWMMLRSEAGGEGVRVHVPRDEAGDYAFTLPQTVVGQRAIVEGIAEVREQDADEQRHYLEDAGAEQADIDAVTEPRQVVAINLRGALVEQPAGVTPPAAPVPMDNAPANDAPATGHDDHSAHDA